MKIEDKAKKIVEASSELVLAYIREDGYPRASTISKLGADGLDTVYMSTAIQLPKAKRIQANPRASLCFRAGGDNVTLTGRITVTQDDRLRSELWQAWMLEHFPDGAAGESYCVFVFKTEEASFWIDGEEGALGREAFK